jgi:hypothetical protein
MSPWDYIKPGLLIVGWLARIRTNKGVRTILISFVDLKMNDPGRASNDRQWRGSAPWRGAMGLIGAARSGGFGARKMMGTSAK